MTERQAKKYVPNVPGLHAICDSNYAGLMRLLPDCDTEDLSYRFSVNDTLQFQIKIIESSRYTSTLEVTQINTLNNQIPNAQMQVRLYHDAKMAEVISSQRISAFKASYAYPNRNMHQKNEKEMVNVFLADWLKFCLLQQRTTVSRV
ncbi:DUF1249 domain-containing protein [Aestuariibacter salexigens]|uniref:DUF1249 domain-containing protein n=1 Tax=Aestuariibacter salexigens TaxID=226010 RepID=UPI000A046C69|nr:DUF1249 domain-containing protein [Aestuariibacter salexigens]